MSKKDFYRTIFSFFWKRKKQVFLFFFFGVVSLCLGFIDPFFSAKFMQALSSIDIQGILIFSAILLGTGVFTQFLNIIKREQERNFQDAVILDTQTFICNELFLLEQKNFDEKGTAFFSSRVNSDSWTVAYLLSRLNSNLFYTLESFGVFIYLFVMSVPIAFYILICSVILCFLRFKRVKKNEQQRTKLEEKRENHSSTFSEIIRGIRDIKVLNLKQAVVGKTLHDQEKINETIKEDRRAMYFYDELDWFLRKVFQFFLFVLAIYLMGRHLFLGANLIVLYTYHGKASSFLDSIFNFWENMVDVKHSFHRIYELMDDKVYTKEKYGTKHIFKLNGDIEFQNVSFAYKEDEVLKNVSFHIKPNDTVGFVGKSGAGKSTIFQLIPKLYQKKKGDILFDGISIDELDEESIRKNISVITQNPYLFNMTIRENLMIVNPEASEKEMIENCKLCAFHDYVMTLPKGYDTFIGEGGVILSGGLRQRLAIARALMKKSEIILLDEATSSLDNETQDFVRKSIEQISENYTILIIAHRLSTIRNCDYIIVVDDGKIVGIGTHDELMKHNKYYKNLYQHELA